MGLLQWFCRHKHEVIRLPPYVEYAHYECVRCFRKRKIHEDLTKNRMKKLQAKRKTEERAKLWSEIAELEKLLREE